MSEEATGNGHQQERGREIKDFLFLFKVLSFEQRVQEAKLDESFVYPLVVIRAGHGHTGRTIGIYRPVIMSCFFTLYLTFFDVSIFLFHKGKLCAKNMKLKRSD